VIESLLGFLVKKKSENGLLKFFASICVGRTVGKSFPSSQIKYLSGDTETFLAASYTEILADSLPHFKIWDVINALSAITFF
jgi:hypothetical protein